MIITYTYGTNLYVNVTNRCDMNCVFCLRNEGDGVGSASNLWLEREPTREEILQDIRKRDLSQFQQIVFCGYGEPTYRIDDILWVCTELKKDGIKNPIRIDTNGHGNLINGRDIVPEMKGKIDIVSVSLNASSAEKYTAMCKPGFGEKSYQAMLDFTAECAKTLPKVIMTIVDSGLPKEEIEACRKICEGLGANYRIRVYSSNW